MAPDSVVAANGINKSKKTILNKVLSEDVFVFSRSQLLFDFLRKEGGAAVDRFLNEENKFRSAVALKVYDRGDDRKEIVISRIR